MPGCGRVGRCGQLSRMVAGWDVAQVSSIMATDAYDANGVWQYGEDDLLSPWSAHMNKLAASI